MKPLVIRYNYTPSDQVRDWQGEIKPVSRIAALRAVPVTKPASLWGKLFGSK